MHKPVTLSLLPVLLLSDPAAAQSLFQRAPASPATPAASAGGSGSTAGAGGEAAHAEGGVQRGSSAGPALAAARSGPPMRLRLRDASLFVVVPPDPSSWKKHDKLEIIINESAISKAEQTLDTKKDYDFNAELSQFPSLQALFLEPALRNGIGADKPGFGVTSKNKFKGEGTYERKDQLTARVSAIVLDVKPNGHLVVEATETIQQDAEMKTMVLSGIVDPKDITNARTVQSAQVANLAIRIKHEGRVKDAGDKGLLPRVFEAIFNF